MTEAMAPQRIFLDVDSDDANDLAKIKWRRRYPWGPAYRVSRGMLEEYSTKARERLEALVAEAMRGNVRQTGGILKELAEAGNRLYRALFHDPEGSGRAAKARDHLKNLEGENQILVSMGFPLHIPWGLVYDGDPKQLSGDPNDTDFDHYRDFWSIKYRVAVVYSTVDGEGADKPLPRDVIVHSVVNQSVLARTAPHLTQSGPPSWEWIVKQFGPPMYSQKGWLARWMTEYDKVGILYFYSHADGNTIGLGVDSISANDLAQDLADQGKDTALPCLVFLNGCSTAVGHPDGGFLEATAGSRFCGFIGAEASIPDVFALRFGSAFLYEFLRSQNTLLEVMSTLRKQHWPLSLLYNLYCVPDLKILSAFGSSPPLSADNFCDFDLGTQGI